MRQGNGDRFDTHRPGYWDAVFSAAAHDFLYYLAFVNDQPPPEHIEVMAERLYYGDHWECFLGPPDSAKSQTLQSWACWTMGRNPNFRWLIASEVASGIATTITTQIGDTIAQNERYAAVFGELFEPRSGSQRSSQTIRLRTYVNARDAQRYRMRQTPPPPPWLAAEEDCPPGAVPIHLRRGRDASLAHANVRAVGWRTGYTGARADGLIADDLMSDKTARSQILTEQVWSTLHQKMLPRLTGQGPAYKRALIAGQIWAPRDVYSYIRNAGVVVYDSNPEMKGLAVLDEYEEAA